MKIKSGPFVLQQKESRHNNSSYNELQASDKAGLPNFMRAGSVEYGAAEVAANDYQHANEAWAVVVLNNVGERKLK